MGILDFPSLFSSSSEGFPEEEKRKSRNIYYTPVNFPLPMNIGFTGFLMNPFN
jgi:hypothetical protein